MIQKLNYLKQLFHILMKMIDLINIIKKVLIKIHIYQKELDLYLKVICIIHIYNRRENKSHFSPGPLYDISESAEKVMFNYGDTVIGPKTPTSKNKNNPKSRVYWNRDSFLNGGIEQKTTLTKVTMYKSIFVYIIR